MLETTEKYRSYWFFIISFVCWDRYSHTFFAEKLGVPKDQKTFDYLLSRRQKRHDFFYLTSLNNNYYYIILPQATSELYPPRTVYLFD